MFPSISFAISERCVEMLTKEVNNNIYIGSLVPFFSSFEAVHYDERIMKSESYGYSGFLII